MHLCKVKYIQPWSVSLLHTVTGQFLLKLMERERKEDYNINQEKADGVFWASDEKGRLGTPSSY